VFWRRWQSEVVVPEERSSPTVHVLPTKTRPLETTARSPLRSIDAHDCENAPAPEPRKIDRVDQGAAGSAEPSAAERCEGLSTEIGRSGPSQHNIDRKETQWLIVHQSRA
jgi:hypothetical protein